MIFSKPSNIVSRRGGPISLYPAYAPLSYSILVGVLIFPSLSRALQHISSAAAALSVASVYCFVFEFLYSLWDCRVNVIDTLPCTWLVCTFSIGRVLVREIQKHGCNGNGNFPYPYTITRGHTHSIIDSCFSKPFI
jgi:hypothetical protein